MGPIHIHGYTDRLSVRPGETLSFMISATGTTAVTAGLVRLIHGDENPEGPGFVEKAIATDLDGQPWPVRQQPVLKGNYLRVKDEADALIRPATFTLYAFVCPAKLNGKEQALLGRWRGGGYVLLIDSEGRLVFRMGQGSRPTEITLPVRLQSLTWYLVAVSVDSASGTCRLYQTPAVNRWNSAHAKGLPWRLDCVREAIVSTHDPVGEGQFLIGARSAAAGAIEAFYNGKIDRCGISTDALSIAALERLAATGMPPSNVLAHWDTSAGYTDHGIGNVVQDVGPHGLHAIGVNRPVRAQTGWNWQGRNDCFRMAPGEYGGIEFHEDALSDCAWEPSLELEIPLDTRSGVYAIKLLPDPLEQHEAEYIPFCVRSRRPTAPLCFIMPTASYLAYANAQTAFASDLAEASDKVTPILQPIDLAMYAQEAPFGLSMYDTHRDGTGVCHSSLRRPIFNMRPRYRMPANTAPWQFAADLSIIAWLEHAGYDYDVLTDHDLHAEGVEALSPYRVVLTGSHCEYTSERMLDATEDYLDQGGRLLYLSGNGYYWVVGFFPDEPWVMEVRRLEAGSRAWQARPGEHYLASTGERGGLWRARGRPPQKLVGTGFTAEGMDVAVPFHRLEASFSSPLAWIFDGIEEEVVGDFGLAKGGAAGLEVDRYDAALGSPPHTLILAHSAPLTDNYQLTQEDVMSTLPGLGGSENPLVRADMTYFTTRNGGAVFSASSIAWASALPCKGFENNVSRIMRNLCDAFLREGPPLGTDWMTERLSMHCRALDRQ